jgi:hypothetical protein
MLRYILIKKIIMNKEQVLGLVRHILTFAGGIILTKGLIDESLYAELVGGITTLIGTVWSVLNKKSIS